MGEQNEPDGASAAELQPTSVSSTVHRTPETERRRYRDVDRGSVIADDLRSVAAWALRLVVVAAALWVLQQATGALWVILLPVLLAVVLSTVLRPPVAFLVRHGFPSSLAAAITMLLGLTGITLAFYAIIRSIIEQSVELADSATEGLRRIEQWIQGPPLNIESDQISRAVDEVTSRLQSSAGQLASGALSGATAVGSALVTLVLVLILTFLFIKDAPSFLPWLRQVAGRKAGRHLTELLTRVWHTLGGFIRTQAIVSAADAVFIAIGLLILGVPLVAALAALTFFGGFIPIVGAFIAGALAVLVALVANGPTTALLVLGLIVLVQQIEGNVLQPILQGRSLNLHPAVVILAVTFGGSIAGIVGAFFAVPVAATLAVALRYFGEQVDLRAGNLTADQVAAATPEGELLAAKAEEKHIASVRESAAAETAGGDRTSEDDRAAGGRPGLVGTILDRVRARRL